MSHALTIDCSGRAEMGYVTGTERWHGLGNELTPDASIEDWKREAGMSWVADAAPVVFTPTGRQNQIVGGQKVLYRNDTGADLGIVSGSYKVVQPGEALEFFRDLVAGNGFRLTTAGTLFGGRKFWATASIGAEASIVSRQDVVGGYLLLSSSLDGSSATRADFTTTCVVCQNTMNMAIGGKRADVRVAHRTVFDATRMKDRLGIARGEFAKFIGAAKALTKVKMNDSGFSDFLLRLTKAEKPEAKLEDISDTPAFKRMLSLFAGAGKGAELPGRSGTAWGAVNAVTEYYDHWAPRKSAEHRMLDAQWGAGDVSKSAAMVEALSLV